jgi:hypothetical protein
MSRGVSAMLQRGNDGWVIPGGYLSYENSTVSGGTAAWTNTGTSKRKIITITVNTTGICPVRLYLPHKQDVLSLLVGSVSGALTATIRRNYLEATLLAGGGGETWTWAISWLPG